jgi:hypothetical protein
LPLAVIEVRRDRDDGFRHLLAQEIFGCALEFTQNHRRNFRRAVGLAENVDARIVVRPARHLIGHAFEFIGDFIVAMPHETLDGINRVFRIRYGLPLGHLPNQPLAGLGNGHHRRSGPATLLVRDYYGLPALHDGNNRIGRSKVDSYDLAHCSLPPSDPRPVSPGMSA